MLPSLKTRQLLPISGVQRGVVPATAKVGWSLETFAGRLGEISGSQSTATLTLAFRLVLEAQRQGEPVAWVCRRNSFFYPPDAAEVSIDLDALVVIWVPDTLRAARAADQLVRSGAFGLVVIDLGEQARLPVAALARLVGLTKRHHTALLCLTDNEDERPSLGSLVSIRAQTVRSHEKEDLYRCRAQVLKDKKCGPGWTHTETCRGPNGLR